MENTYVMFLYRNEIRVSSYEVFKRLECEGAEYLKESSDWEGMLGQLETLEHLSVGEVEIPKQTKK